jgi:stearoyl-CoA desaturase (delta-9 desaturase)
LKDFLKMTHNQIVRGLQISNHVLALVGCVVVFYTGYYSLFIVSILFYIITGILGVNVGYHRLLSHKSFKTYNLIERILSLVGIVTTIGSPMAWVAVHRQHHKAAETDTDPHSPYKLGKFNAWVGYWNYLPLSPRLVKDMRKDTYQKFLHQHYLEIILFYCLILALINPWLIIFAYAIPACLCLHSTSAIIVIAHIHGYKTYNTNDQSRNSWIAHIMSLGEGWHNNHHAKPYAWQQGEKWWELDPPAWIIRLIKND